MYLKFLGKIIYFWFMEIENVIKLINRCRISVERFGSRKKLEWVMYIKELRNDKKRLVC